MVFQRESPLPHGDNIFVGFEEGGAASSVASVKPKCRISAAATDLHVTNWDPHRKDGTHTVYRTRAATSSHLFFEYAMSTGQSVATVVDRYPRHAELPDPFLLNRPSNTPSTFIRRTPIPTPTRISLGRTRDSAVAGTRAPESEGVRTRYAAAACAGVLRS